MNNLSASLDSIWMFVSVVLPIILALFALALNIARPGKNAQAVRAAAVVTLFTLRFWLGIAVLLWAAADAFFPNIANKLPDIGKKLKKK